MERYPIGIQTFSELIGGGWTYVDKTGYIVPLTQQYKYCFLARPRRFGKSLFLSTLKSYFEGRSDLFEGLEVSQVEKDWKKHPVIHLSFASLDPTNPAAMAAGLLEAMHDIADDNGVEIKSAEVSIAFKQLIRALSKQAGEQVVILIDEYDKGLVDTLHDGDKMAATEDMLRPFYAVLKDQDANIRFAMLTGVGRFRHLSLFSGANNIRDISFLPKYAGICGVTQSELVKYFPKGIANISAQLGLTEEQTLSELKNTYDGYRFTSGEEYLYNPYSLLNAFDEGALKYYWAMTGTTRIFVETLKRANFKMEELLGVKTIESRLSSLFSATDPVPLMFQTGYLTIKDYCDGLYTLDIPNREVQSALVDVLLPAYLNSASSEEMPLLTSELRTSLHRGDADKAMDIIQSILSGVPYNDIDAGHLEAHFHACLNVVMLLCGVAAQCERQTSHGRIDMVALTPQYAYVFEFKLDKPAEDALAQINDKDYAMPYRHAGRKVIKVGVSFSSSKRNIQSWKIEK